MLALQTCKTDQSYKQAVLKELRTIPGVGKQIALDLWNIGVRSVDELRNRNPDVLYFHICDYQGMQVDRCMLYVLRCAVYYASNETHNPDLLKWWNWQDKHLNTQPK